MPESVTNLAENTTTQEVRQPVKTGSIQKITMTFPQDNVDNNTDQNQNTEGANATSGANNGGAADANTNKATPPAPTFTDDELKAWFKEKGIDYEGVDKLKEQLTKKETSPELTEAQIKAKEQAKEKRLLDKFMSDGQSAETYVAIKGVASADPTQYALNVAKTELIKIGYTAEEADVYVKENLLQIDDAELEQLEDESDRSYKKRVKEFNAKLLAANSNPHIEKAKWVLQNLNEAIEAEDLQVQQEIALSSKIEDDFKALPRKMSIEIGEIGGKTVSPVDYDVSETDIAEVKAMLKDPTQRQQFLFNEDGSLNTTKLTEVLVKAKAFDSAAKVSFHTGMTKAIADFQKVFPATSMQELGVGGSPQKPKDSKPGQPVSYGKVQRVQPQRQ